MGTAATMGIEENLALAYRLSLIHIYIVMIGLMAAVVFVVTMFLSIRIPTPTGTTMIKLANAFVPVSYTHLPLRLV